MGRDETVMSKTSVGCVLSGDAVRLVRLVHVKKKHHKLKQRTPAPTTKNMMVLKLMGASSLAALSAIVMFVASDAVWDVALSASDDTYKITH